jgi:glycerophosphoryl diester phosphodiesterase
MASTSGKGDRAAEVLLGGKAGEVKDLSRIVCHRGFHDPELLDRTRPVENTLVAYEKAWKHFDLCECDITCSADGILFLCHDETYQRVSDPEHSVSKEFAKTPVSDLKAGDIEKIKLLDGSKPTKLIEVLERAKGFGGGIGGYGKKKMVVELKKDAASERVIAKLRDLLDSRADLAEHVAVIMSFDLEMMQAMSKWKLTKQANNVVKLIKLMLLTEAPTHWKEGFNTLCMDVCSHSFRIDCSRVVRDNKLDGIYLEYQAEMTECILSLRESKHHDELKGLANDMFVGIWNYSTEQPDGLKTLDALTQLGVNFVNSDMPEDEIVFLGWADKPERESCFDALWLFCIYGYER